MKKHLLLVLFILVFVCACDNNTKNQEIVPKYNINDYYFEKLPNNEYSVSMIVENVSNTNINVAGYFYDVYNGTQIIKEDFYVNEEIIKANKKSLVKFIKGDLGESVSSIHLYLMDKKYGYLDNNLKQGEYFKELYYIDEFDESNSSISITFSNEENIKINELELIAYSENNKPICVSYLKYNKTNDVDTLTFDCSNLVDNVDKLKLSYH